MLAPPVTSGTGPKCVSHNQANTMIPSSQESGWTAAFLAKVMQRKQGPRALAQWSWGAGNIGRIYKCQKPKRRDQEKELQPPYLQLSAHEMRTMRHNICIRNILPTVDSSYHFVRLQWHRWNLLIEGNVYPTHPPVHVVLHSVLRD